MTHETQHRPTAGRVCRQELRRIRNYVVVLLPDTRSIRGDVDGMDKISALQRAKASRALHANGTFVLPNAWDAASAVVMAGAGAPAIATTSSGISWSLGVSDGERLSQDEMVAATERIVRAVSLPVRRCERYARRDASRRARHRLPPRVDRCSCARPACLIVVGLALLAAGCGSARSISAKRPSSESSPTSGSASGSSPSLSVSPSTGLVGGQGLHVSLSGFPQGATVLVYECAGVPPAGSAIGCGGAGSTTVYTGATGAASGAFTAQPAAATGQPGRRRRVSSYASSSLRLSRWARGRPRTHLRWRARRCPSRPRRWPDSQMPSCET
jgi:hypothetical protein